MKTMKKVLSVALTVFALLISCLSCDKKDKTEKYLIGSWNLAQMHVVSKENGIKISDDVSFPVSWQMIWTFNEDGSCSSMSIEDGVGGPEVSTGRWQYLNNSLVLTFDGEDYMSWRVVSVDKEQLVLMYSESGLTGDYDDEVRISWEDIITYTFTRMK